MCLSGRGRLIDPGYSELVEALGQEIAQQRLAEQVTHGLPTRVAVSVPPLSRLATQILPLVDRPMAPSEPHQRDQVDLFVLVQGPNETRHLGSDSVAAIVLQYVDFSTLSRIRSRLLIGRQVRDSKPMRVFDQNADLL